MFDQPSAGQIMYIDLSWGHPNSWFRKEITLDSRLGITQMYETIFLRCPINVGPRI